MKKIGEQAEKMVIKSEDRKMDENIKLPLKIITDYDRLRNMLTSENFKTAKDVDDADIVWSYASIKDDITA